MPISQELLQSVVSSDPQQAWAKITESLWTEFSATIPSAVADTEVVRRDRNLTELDNVLSGAAWGLWRQFESIVPRASQSLIEFWGSIQGGKAILILDGLSLRETPWLLEQAVKRGYKIHQAAARGSELPAETTPFANALGFSQRSALENNMAGSAHRLPGAFTAAGDLPWQDCQMAGTPEHIVFWHHWPDERSHTLAKPGEALHRLARETHAALVSDDFWAFVERLCTGRRLVITGDHGYAACGHFPDLVDVDQVAYMKKLFKSGRSATTESDGTADNAAWVPPMDLRLTTLHGDYQFVLGRRKWKSPSGYPTLHHGGLSLLETFVPFIELS